jgi:hypothetical protein
MRAMVTPQFGAPDRFEERDTERPQPGPGEVLVRVAAGTNPVDAKFRSSGDALGLETQIILGSDVWGVVEQVGSGVTDLAPGDEVYYYTGGFGSQLERRLRRVSRREGGHRGEVASLALARGGRRAAIRGHGLRGHREAVGGEGWRDGTYSWRSLRPDKRATHRAKDEFLSRTFVVEEPTPYSGHPCLVRWHEG